MRTYVRIFTAVAALALGGAVTAAGTGAAAAAAPPATELTITYLATPASQVVVWQLVCDPAGGTHPDPVGACELLEKATADPFKPVPPGTICLPFSDGPETAHITGRWRDQPVDASFNRVHSCEIARWDNLVPVLPKHK
ncbi:SSI family serine proteinase inhibitor [Phytohabitans sp. LJ34]|uniref:SSI family serine proteinase inhibitor n=1 Tax=Phytohabitans sp. LJ34 TaxID=3452217 RepID=UPI003F890A4E